MQRFKKEQEAAKVTEKVGVVAGAAAGSEEACTKQEATIGKWQKHDGQGGEGLVVVEVKDMHEGQGGEGLVVVEVKDMHEGQAHTDN
jgi:hypothetical protein